MNHKNKILDKPLKQIKLSKSIFEITSNHTVNPDLTVIFGFGREFLLNGKKMVKSAEITPVVDLSLCGEYHLLYNQKGTFLLVSLGQKNEFNLANYLKSLKNISNYIAKNKNIVRVNIILEEQISNILDCELESYIEQTIVHSINYLYYFDEQKSQAYKLALKQVNFISKVACESIIVDAINIIEGIFILKHLANTSANVATPSYIADTARNFDKLSKKVAVNILDYKEIKKAKMHTFLAVAKGSAQEPKFIHLEYNGGKQSSKPIVLIGKGITFDSGGISLKPSSGMEEMKYDMCGAATVIGLFVTAVKLQLPLNLVVLVPSCENMPSGEAAKPGDVVETMSGKTVEIINTDAEGRLLLCDALTYAKKLNPDFVIDIATLTGACVVALGDVASGLFSNDDKLADEIISSASQTGDKMWRLPLFSEYHDMLKSNTADIANISNAKRSPGCAIAACFLENFVEYKWVHLDVAGTAFGNSIYNSIDYQGATGRPFYALINFLRKFAS